MIVLKGNDVTLEWTIFKCLDGAEVPEDFREADLKVSLVYRGKQIPAEYSVLGNLISVTISGDEQPLGIVGVEAVWSKNDPPEWSRMFEPNAVEFTNIPERVAEGCQIGEGENTVIKAKSILHGSVGYDGVTPRIGENGNWFIGQTDTGYSSKGDAFLFEDFTPEQIETLQRPAIDAAESVSQLEATISSNEQARVTKENQRIDAETARATSENLRNNNEEARITSEESRASSEINREAKEQERVEAEKDRGGQELIRVEAERSRVVAESKRAADTNTAIRNCETAATNANSEAVYAKEQGDYTKSVGDSLPEFILLTQAEYDALPDSKLTDGNYYTIV